LHLLIVEDDYEDLYEVFGADLGVEGGRTLVHEHVKQAERKEHDFGLICLEAFSYLIGYCLAPNFSFKVLCMTYSSAF
jgi:hypothetical protein